MGLDTTHGCWHGSYPGFTQWRNALAHAAGYDLLAEHADLRVIVVPDLPEEIWDGNHHLGDWDETPEDPLLVLLAHADNEGRIEAHHAGPLADRLEELIPALEKLADPDVRGRDPTVPLGYEPIQPHRVAQWQNATRKFITGLRRAVEEGEPVEFH